MSFLTAGVLLLVMLVASLFGQDQPVQPVPSAPPDGSAPGAPAAGKNPEAEPPGGNRVSGALPNSRTADSSLIGTVLTNRAKLDIAGNDSFDYPLVGLARALAGLE